MAKRSKGRVPKWVSNAERREFATEIAAREYGGWADASSVLLRLGYARGIYDAMLPEPERPSQYNNYNPERDIEKAIRLHNKSPYYRKEVLRNMELIRNMEAVRKEVVK